MVKILSAPFTSTKVNSHEFLILSCFTTEDDASPGGDHLAKVLPAGFDPFGYSQHLQVQIWWKERVLYLITKVETNSMCQNMTFSVPFFAVYGTHQKSVLRESENASILGNIGFLAP